MNPKLKEINEIIAQCDRMMDVAQKSATSIRTTNIIAFIANELTTFVLCIIWKTKLCTLCHFVQVLDFLSRCNFISSEIAAIKHNLILIKHTLFENAYEKIFISHREKDAEQVAAFVDLLHVIGIPRPTIEAPERVIFVPLIRKDISKMGIEIWMKFVI